MSSLRLKVQFGENLSSSRDERTATVLKFIYAVEQPTTTTIDDLTRALQKYINQQLSTYNTQIVQLTTADGFVLPKFNSCSSVLNNNDYLICIDTKKCASDTYLLINFSKAWLEMKQHDASDDYEKCIQIGLNNILKLYIRLFGTATAFGLWVFDTSELIQIATEKRKDNLIARADNADNDDDENSPSDWFLECKWEYDTSSNTNLFIICSLKTGSDDNVLSYKLQLILDHSRMRIKKGEITHLSGDADDGSTLTNEQKERLQELAAQIPRPERSGPEIDTSTRNLKITKHECEGESSIRMTNGNTNTVETYQAHHTEVNNTFTQCFTIKHIIFSKKSTILPEILNQKRSQPVDKPVSVADLTVFYQMHDGAWRECQDVAIAPIPIRNEEPRWLTESVINILPDKLISFTIRGTLRVKGDIGLDNAARERMHRSLPQPFKFKIVVTDSSGKQCSLIVEQLNKPLDPLTRESFIYDEKSNIGEFLAFTYADDVEQEKRLHAGIFINKLGELVVKISGSYTGAYDRKIIRAMQYRAKQNKTLEVDMEGTTYDFYDTHGRAIAIFDPETYMFYAVRLELTTKTSKTVETVLIPVEKIKSTD
ncbi:unnamed protein product [Adineta steineri]|uniref:Uncharacterized protein n=1 Tax=Adineta steineri TaxID=433720 RepID=A0A818MEB9_9BILA|nr:unnamed protein product [Adineta steineri]CAF3580911.1 unnamed protein product [Adineta steineri]